ncbi:glycosyltransferase family 4 protein [Meiothermus sp. CFH 77666]|uniref:glycosyltransferase family 4 protein n=1 Tax=Meiothermus sp. CFH 77666 TaxID=2817942 RepID=UPI001AA07CCD|nr:glycosyltransferase family 4 protein [Meiothermus sp. CFH 77666]MBO1438042.1 glycosyltransferase family 4 protein [Meiothermus sp. CFH 77666]
MPKLLIVATTALFFTEFLLPYARHFRRLGWQVDGAAAGASTCEQSRAVFDRLFEVQMSRKAHDPRNLLLGLRELRSLVEREGYDIVHVHTPVAAFVTRLALRTWQARGRGKLIYTAHGFHFHPRGHPLKNALFYALEWLGARYTDYLVVMNEADRQAACRLVGPERTVYMPGIGVDLDFYSGRRVPPEAVARLRESLGLGPAQPYLLMIAEFIPRKRHRDALEAFALLGHPTAHLVLAGEGVLLEEMKALAARLGLVRRVHFLGFRRDIPTLIQGAVATLLPSEQEGLPRAIMESFCLGVPVIGADVRGIRELLQGGAGLLHPLGDVPALARAMRFVLENLEESRKMGHLGQERVKAYDLRNILRLHEELYARALGKPTALEAV